MAEIKIKFDLTFSRRFIAAARAAAMMFCAVPELESESVTPSTYYPAPSRVYPNMIRTSNPYRAGDGGNVGCGTTAPGSKRTAAGRPRMQQMTPPGGSAPTTADPHVADILLG